MDLKTELADFAGSLQGRFLLRHSSKLKCNCIDPVTGDAKATCVLCGGTGMRYTLIPVEAIRQLGSTPDSYPFLLFQTDLGKTAVPALKFYFNSDTAVRTGDELWDVEWRGDVPVNVKSVAQLSYVDRVTEANFREVYIRAYGKLVPNQMGISRFIVKTQAGIKVYEPQFGGGAV